MAGRLRGELRLAFGDDDVESRLFDACWLDTISSAWNAVLT